MFVENHLVQILASTAIVDKAIGTENTESGHYYRVSD
jgi:hypothetical protein